MWLDVCKRGRTGSALTGTPCEEHKWGIILETWRRPRARGRGANMTITGAAGASLGTADSGDVSGLGNAALLALPCVDGGD